MVDRQKKRNRRTKKQIEADNKFKEFLKEYYLRNWGKELSDRRAEGITKALGKLAETMITAVSGEARGLAGEKEVTEKHLALAWETVLEAVFSD